MSCMTIGMVTQDHSMPMHTLHGSLQHNTVLHTAKLHDDKINLWQFTRCVIL